MVQMTAHNGIPKKFEQVNEKETFLVYYRRMKILDNVNIEHYTHVFAHIYVILYHMHILVEWGNGKCEEYTNRKLI